jgi:hypothetical protein
VTSNPAVYWVGVSDKASYYIEKKKNKVKKKLNGTYQKIFKPSLEEQHVNFNIKKLNNLKDSLLNK